MNDYHEFVDPDEIVDDAYQQGRAAFDRGIDRDCCPFTDPAEREIWCSGWDDACNDQDIQ